MYICMFSTHVCMYVCMYILCNAYGLKVLFRLTRTETGHLCPSLCPFIYVFYRVLLMYLWLI